MTINQYIPIVLGNFLYKIISKILANQRSVVVAKIISSNQFGFLRGMNMNEDIVLASGCVNLPDKKYAGVIFPIRLIFVRLLILCAGILLYLFFIGWFVSHFF